MSPSSFLYVLRRLLASAHGRRLHARATLWAGGFTVAFLLVGSWIIAPIEESAPHATITTFPRALWWSVETATTVGYGDFFPVTAWGRVIASLVMLVGIEVNQMLGEHRAARAAARPKEAAGGDSAARAG